uniref:Uncharacterized protein n=1 Tax=Buteo japonicus TaxID=224669 RepID=A0A8C0B6F5_9AVES
MGNGSLWYKGGMGNSGRGWQSTIGLHHTRWFSFVDNTYVSSSDNDEDVLVTTEPIPVIFHQIATELRKTSDVNYCLSIRSKLQRENGEESQHNSTVEEDSEGDNDSEEFYYGGQVSYDGELHKHPQLEADLTAVREIYGPNAVSLREYGAIDDVDIDLHIDVSFLDEEIAVAWDVIRTEPIIVRLHCSLTQYLNGPDLCSTLICPFSCTVIIILPASDFCMTDCVNSGDL